MRVVLKRVDERMTKKQLVDAYNTLVSNLEQVFCKIGEDNLSYDLKKKLKLTEDKNNG